MYNIKDNIVAVATASGKSALNVVRCSGPGSLALYGLLTKATLPPKPNFAHLKTLYYKGRPIDQMMITYFKGPKSFTKGQRDHRDGETVRGPVHLHGSSFRWPGCLRAARGFASPPRDGFAFVVEARGSPWCLRLLNVNVSLSGSSRLHAREPDIRLRRPLSGTS